MIHRYFVLALSALATQSVIAADQVQCKQMGNNIVVTATSEGAVYAVNGTARAMATSQGWKDGKDHFEAVNLQSLLQQGIKSCSASGSMPVATTAQKADKVVSAQVESTASSNKASSSFTREGFAKAASNGDVEALKQYIAGGFSPDTLGPDMPWINRKGSPVIAEAAAAKKCAAVDYLLSAGAKPDYPGVRYGWTPIAHAAQAGAVDCVRSLLASGARPDVALEPGGDTPIIVAAYQGHLDVVKLLLEHGASLKTKNKDGDTAYRAAIVGGSGSTAQYLRSKGGN
jgi:hypothetical protein